MWATFSTATLYLVREIASVRSPRASLIVLGLVYAGFSLLLYARGVAPRAVWLPVAPSDYYLAQAFFVLPLFWLLAYVFAIVVRACAGVRSHSLEKTFGALAPRYALPIVVLFLLPDLVVFLAFGHAALAPAMKFYGPLAPIAIIGWTTHWLHRHANVGLGRALFASFIGLVAQTLLGAPVLR